MCQDWIKHETYETNNDRKQIAQGHIHTHYGV